MKLDIFHKCSSTSCQPTSFIVPTPMNQKKQSSARTQDIPITSYFRMVTQTQSGNWMLRVGTSWINQQRSESRIWNPPTKIVNLCFDSVDISLSTNKKHQLVLYVMEHCIERIKIFIGLYCLSIETLVSKRNMPNKSNQIPSTQQQNLKSKMRCSRTKHERRITDLASQKHNYQSQRNENFWVFMALAALLWTTNH